MRNLIGKQDNKSIFRSLLVPFLVLTLMQAVVFYAFSMYGSLQGSLENNAVDIMRERLINRRSELTSTFNNSWSNLEALELSADRLYEEYKHTYGDEPFASSKEAKVEFLEAIATDMMTTLRKNHTNGVFIILNDGYDGTRAVTSESPLQAYGLCIRDLDQSSNYTGVEDLLVERAPIKVVEAIGCSLDSWWEATYSFESTEEGAYYFKPLMAALDNDSAEGKDLAYISPAYELSPSDRKVTSYSMPLMDENGKPYAVIGVELTTSYLASVLPYGELGDRDRSCYILGLKDEETQEFTTIVGVGALYSRCFAMDYNVTLTDEDHKLGGFRMKGRSGTALYGTLAALDVYNRNNPFSGNGLTLLAIMDEATLFSYVSDVKTTMVYAVLAAGTIGIIGIIIISKLLSSPIKALADDVRGMTPSSESHLRRLGITEIDQLVDSLEALNTDVNKNTARTEFFSRMSHDMRTPMNAIIGFSSPELLNGESEATKDEYLQKIHASGGYLLGLINEVLDMTKIESNKTDLTLSTELASGLWDIAIPMTEKLAASKGVSFTVNVDSNSDLWVLADKQHLNQIAINLLSNAVKFTPSGGSIKFTASTSVSAEEIGRADCVFTCSDTGVGIPSSFMDNLYKPFEQARSNMEGTGLGLSIAKHLVELMGGTIDCRSIVGRGTTFAVNVPLEIADAPGSGVTAVTYEPDTEQDSMDYKQILNGKRVLVVEDQPINTLIVRKLLEKMGIVVDAVENGSLCVSAFSNAAPGTYDAILMDIRMPVMGGLEAARAIRQLPGADAAAIPIIAMTANAFETDVKASAAAGMNSHLSKPVQPQLLYETLAEFLVKQTGKSS